MTPKRRKPLVQPKVRLRDDLHKRLAQAAKKAGRSLNQEIALRLEQSFSRQEQESATGELKQWITRQQDKALREILKAVEGYQLSPRAHEEFEALRKAEEEQEK